jgi:hypothetical protein
MQLARVVSLAVSIFTGLSFWPVAAQDPDLYAIVERSGTVVLCLSKTQILFADRCAGSAQLMIVQPVQEGEIVWRTAVGTIVIENGSPQNPDCALSRAKWNPKEERGTPSGKRIRKVDPSVILTSLNRQRYIKAELTEGDVSAFALDLDNDGNDEVVVSVSNLERIARLNEKTRETYPYVVMGAIMHPSSGLPGGFPAPFYFEQGDYVGGTDAIGEVVFKGVVPIAIEAGDIALLAVVGNGSNGTQDLMRYRGVIQRIETIERRCD